MNEIKTIDPKNRLIVVLLTEPTLSKLMGTIIRMEGYSNVVIANTKEEARAILENEQVDLFILNNRLGGISGEDFIRETVLKNFDADYLEQIPATKTLLFTGGWVNLETSPATKVLIQNDLTAREIATTINSLLCDP